VDAQTALEPAALPVIRPMRTLGLVSTLHAANHAQAVLMPLIYIAVIDEWGVSIGTIGLLVAISSLASGLAQATYASLTRHFTRARLLGWGGVVMGGLEALMALSPGIIAFGGGLTVARVGGSPQHPVGNGLLAEQFPPERRGFAISAHIAGGNVGTVMVPLLGAWLIAGWGWRWTLVLFGIPTVLIALGIVAFVRESGSDRAAAVASGRVRDAFRTVWFDRDLRWLYLSSVLGGGGRGLGVVNVFIPLYLAQVLALSASTVALMYAVLVAFSVPAPLVAGWLSDRLGRKPLIVGVYIGGAIAFGVVILAGSNIAALWFGILLLGLFNFAESPQLQALLADIAPPAIRDASYSAYFTLAFGVGSLWVALYSVVIDALGPDVGLPVVFGLMAVAFLLAACAVLPIHADSRAAENAAFETGQQADVTP
jgi:MFS transporter, FSR family, fosmidomycin resistance protein